MNIRYDMFALSQNVNTTIFYQFMINFVPFLRANFGQKWKQKFVFCLFGFFLFCFAYFWHILRKVQLVPKKNLVEFVTFDIFKLYMSNKANTLVQKCSKFIFKCFILQIVPNGMMYVEL